MTSEVESILQQVIERRAAGEAVPDAEVLAAHPELASDLAEQLAALRSIRLAMLESHRSHGESEGPAPATVSPVDVPHVPGYAILSTIGHGAQGAVYLAIHEITGRKVALKVIGHGAAIVSSRQRLRFGREADVMAAIDHPHIVKITDRGFTPTGAMYLAMDYIDGPALDDWLAERRTSSRDFERDVAAIFRKVALAVQAVHDHGIVHRDLKPTNIRVDREGNPHVLDFGLARVMSLAAAFGEGGGTTDRHATVTGQVVGSLPWASPEQAAGRIDEVDGRSDVYSLGVMLYQAITGEFPYRVDVELRQLLENIAGAEPPTPIRLGYRGRPPCSAALEAIVLRMLAKDRSVRYGSAQEVADELQRWLDGRPVLADVSRQQRRRRLVATVALGVLLLMGLGSGWFIATRPAPPRVFEMPTQTNALGMRLVRLPPGPVILGSPLEEPGRSPDERQYSTRVERAFWISAHEVTRGQYRAVMGALPPDLQSIAPGDDADDLPVTGVRWTEAEQFCRRLSAREGAVYRLPTETEWEYAARAGMTGPYGGSGYADTMAWHEGNSGGQLHPVGVKWPNHWGLFDMHGNAAEWCLDKYGPVYPSSNSIDPRVPDAEYPRVVRGGSVDQPAAACRSAARQSLHPNGSSATLGFRVVMEAASDSAPE